LSKGRVRERSNIQVSAAASKWQRRSGIQTDLSRRSDARGDLSLDKERF
jgi:hypothetical protein